MRMTKSETTNHAKIAEDVTAAGLPGERDIIDRRLLASMAAHVAASVVSAPSKRATSPEAIAEIAVDIAEAILRRVHL
jgi:hypothetical protein